MGQRIYLALLRLQVRAFFIFRRTGFLIHHIFRAYPAIRTLIRHGKDLLN
jgi:hypothetical protein